MALPGRFDPRVVRATLAIFLSGVLHLGLFLVILLSGGGYDGIKTSETSSTQLVLLEAPDADRRERVDSKPLEPTLASTQIAERLHTEIDSPAPPSVETIRTEPADPQGSTAAEAPVTTNAITNEADPAAATFVMSSAEKAALSRRLVRLAGELSREPQSRVTWEQDGKQYSALLILERGDDGTALERVIAEVSAADRGKRVATRAVLKRLAFSQFTQMVDHWDPMVQLHDDEIVGRFHSNSRFNVTYDSRTAPKFLGKVTTAARSFDMRSAGRKLESDIFQGGVETRADRIRLPEALQPSEWAPHDANARVHELAADTRIRFFADGSYTWRTRGATATGYLNEPSEHPVYFIAAGGATLYVKGVVAGKILVYSPQKIVIEGNLTYAHDPRHVPNSRDYLGLVSDRYIEVAPPGVTGSGDLQIHGALFAGRRFVVRDIEHNRPAVLRIYGSLSAGSLSASEPRYATRIEYDGRFEQRRPPGFPSTNRYEVEDWDGQWTETERTAEDAF